MMGFPLVKLTNWFLTETFCIKGSHVVVSVHVLLFLFVLLTYECEVVKTWKVLF